MSRLPARRHGRKLMRRAPGVGYPTLYIRILHPILHPKSFENTAGFSYGCRKCRRFQQNFFWAFSGGYRRQLLCRVSTTSKRFYKTAIIKIQIWNTLAANLLLMVIQKRIKRVSKDWLQCQELVLLFCVGACCILRNKTGHGILFMKMPCFLFVSGFLSEIQSV